MKHSRGARREVLGLYLLLTFLAWGLFAFDTGLWQDAVNSLQRALGREGPMAGFLAAGVTATRRLKSVIYAFAVRSDHPVVLLQLVSGSVWLGQGLLADRLARQIFAGRAWVGLIAGGLTLCATGDVLSGSLVGLGYQSSMLAFLGATILLVRWCREDRTILLVGSAGLLVAGLWTSDGLITSLVLVPVLLSTLPQRSRQRIERGALVWGLVALPYLGLFAWELLRAGSYPRRALLSVSLGEWTARTLRLFAYNFTPWRWVEHPVPYNAVGPDRLVPLWVYVVASLLGTALFLVVLHRLRGTPCGDPEQAGNMEGPRWQTLLVLALMTLAVNGAFAMVQAADFLYRTHLVSRVWASLLVTGVAVHLMLARPVIARAAPVLPALFVACGLWGGVERQDFFVASWRLHHAELASILEAVPGVSAGTVLVMVVPREPAFLATEASYLASSWAALLYQDPTMAERTVLWSADRRTGCRFEAKDLACWAEGQDACFAAGTCSGVAVPYERSVVIRYSPQTGRFALVEDLHILVDDPLPDAARRYDPHQRLVSQDVSPWVQSLLRESRFLGRFLGPPGLGAREPGRQ